jgi:8-oxo-dGTP pyrophosphatase MutT (NUDIX family)
VAGKRTSEDSGRSAARQATPWQRLSSNLVHSTRWFVVRQDDVVRPDGSEGIYERVDSPGAVTVLAIDDDDRVAITRQWIYLHENTQWRLPGGGIDPDDASPLDAAKRELAEETGIRAAQWTSLGRLNCADSLTNHVAHLFLATGLTQGESSLAPGEADLRVLRVPLRQAVALAMHDQVPDAGSAHVLVKFAALRAHIGTDPVDVEYRESETA